MSSRELISRPRSKTDHQTWTLPRGAKTSHPGPGMTWAQDDMSASSLKRSYISNGPARPAPLPPMRVSSIKPVRKAPPPPMAGSKTVKKSSPVTNYSPEPPPIPSSPRPSISRHRSILESDGHSKSLPPSPKGSRSMLAKKQDTPVALTSSLMSYSSQPPSSPPDCEDLYELTPSFKMKDDTPPPLPNRPVSVSSRPSSASSLDRPPPPPKTNPPGPRPPPPPPPPSVPIPQLPPKPDKYRSYAQPQEDNNGGYCDVDSAVQLKVEYELSQKVKQAMSIELKTHTPPPPPPVNKIEEEYEEDVYEQMASHIVEDDYIVMSPVNTLVLPKKKKGKESSDSIPQEPSIPVLPPKPRQLHSTSASSSQITIGASPLNTSSETRQKSPKPGPKPTNSDEARKRSLPKKSSAFCLPSDHSGTTVGLLKTVPKNKTSAPHFPPPSPPPSFGQVKVLPKNKSSAPHLPPPPIHHEEEEEKEIQEDYEPVEYNIDDDSKDEDQDIYV